MSVNPRFMSEALRETQSMLEMSRRGVRARLLLGALLGSAIVPAAFAQAQYTPDPGCNTQEAWWVQINGRTDPIGKNNVMLPLEVATYWGTELTGTQGSSVTVEGQFPAARYMSLELYDSTGNTLGDLHDDTINPDPGQNNPYLSGSSTTLGTYTVQLIFGQQPAAPLPNTLYAGSATSVDLMYRVYYPNDSSTNPSDLTGGAFPALPTISVAGVALPTCPPRPIINPQTSTVWGREGQNAFVGVAPTLVIPAFHTPLWILTAGRSSSSLVENQDDSYMSAVISRQYLTAPFNYDLVVMQMRAPTFTDTQAGVAPYANADMRFWAMCTTEILSTGVVRCLADDQAPSVNGLVTFVISDPSNQPSASVLSQWGASWMAWGALEPSDYVYNPKEDTLNNANGVFYYDLVVYRQTLANPSFMRSIANVSQLPLGHQQAAMGAYFPEIGYCKLQDFQIWGAACIGRGL